MRVDFIHHKEDLRVAVLGSLGFSTDYIAQVTGLSVGQVLYRLRKASVTRNDYRNGSSSTAAFVQKVAEFSVKRELKQQFSTNGRG